MATEGHRGTDSMATNEKMERRIKVTLLVNGLLLIAAAPIALLICLNGPWYAYALPVLFLAGGAATLLWRKHYKYPFGW
jgi:hypothetical protein